MCCWRARPSWVERPSEHLFTYIKKSGSAAYFQEKTMSEQHDFSTADLIDIAPDTPSCETQFHRFGRHRHFCGKIHTR